MDQFLLALGILLVLYTGASILFTLILPRTPKGIGRVSITVNRVVRITFDVLTRFVNDYELKDALLAPVGPVALVAQLVLWAGSFVLGFGLMLEGTTHDFANAMLQATVSFFTLGSVQAGGVRVIPIDVTAGAIWAIVVALQIAYLPALYGAFNSREGLVAMLESRAGVPAWGPEVLARHQLVGIIDTLPRFYSDWEAWAADLAESHTTYPVLLLFRSPEPWFSWLIGLLAVLDGAAMHLALSPDTASSQARLCLRMGFTALNRIARTLGFEVDPDPNPEGPLQLTFEEFNDAVETLVEIGFPLERSAEDAWPDFKGWRINYESIAYHLADRVTAPPAPWSGPRRQLRSAAPVAPKRPPQRKPGGFSFASRRPPPLGDPSSRQQPDTPWRTPSEDQPGP